MKTISWHGHEVFVNRYNDGHESVEVGIFVGKDQLEFYGRGPNLSIALCDLEFTLVKIANEPDLSSINVQIEKNPSYKDSFAHKEDMESAYMFHVAAKEWFINRNKVA